MARVVVVGGGFGGTAAAARLAKLGHQVTLVERRDRLGGAVGFVERDCYRWDAGPSSTALPAVLRDLFRTSGRPLERELDLVPVEPVRAHHFADGSVLPMPSGSRGGQLEAVEESLGAGLGQQWVDYVHGHADAWDLLRRSYLERPWSVDPVDRPARALLRTRTSLHRAVTRALTDERLRQLALHATVLDGQDPRRVPSWVGMWSYVEQNFGVWTVPGGMGRLAELMTKRLGERRVEVLLGTTAHDLRLEGGAGGRVGRGAGRGDGRGVGKGASRATGVLTDRGVLDADVVVVAVDPARLPALAASVRRARPAPPPTVVHLGLRGEVPDLPAEVVLHGDPTLVVRTTGTAPEGHAAWTVLARGRACGDVVLDLADRGLDVRPQVEVRVDRSPRDQVDELAGSAYGVRWQGRSTVDRLLLGMPHAGVLAAGVHVAAGAGLPSVGLTAAVVAQRVGRA